MGKVLQEVKGTIYMPVITPQQKLQQTKLFGEDFIDIKLVGDILDGCAIAAKQFIIEHGLTFIPPFDDYRIIEGQATVGVEILDDNLDIDYLFIYSCWWWRVECRC